MKINEYDASKSVQIPAKYRRLPYRLLTQQC